MRRSRSTLSAKPSLEKHGRSRSSPPPPSPPLIFSSYPPLPLFPSQGTKLMTPSKARAIWAIYVWCRRTDELVDGPNAPRMTPAALDRWEERLEALFEGRPYDILDAALTDTVSRFAVDIQPFRDMVRARQVQGGPSLRACDGCPSGVNRPGAGGGAASPPRPLFAGGVRGALPSQTLPLPGHSPPAAHPKPAVVNEGALVAPFPLTTRTFHHP